MDELYFEDIDVGSRYECGTQKITREEIIEVGERFDPQPYHVDEATAEERFGGLLASAIHTLGICQRQVTDELFARFVTDAGAGFDEVQCHSPAFAGDTLTVEAEILDKRRLESQPERGLVRVEYSARDQNDDDVMTAVALPFLRRREY